MRCCGRKRAQLRLVMQTLASHSPPLDIYIFLIYLMVYQKDIKEVREDACLRNPLRLYKKARILFLLRTRQRRVMPTSVSSMSCLSLGNSWMGRITGINSAKFSATCLGHFVRSVGV